MEAVLHEDDTALVERALHGDLEAFARLVERHRDAVHRLAARLVGESEAEDVTQDALLRAFHKLATFRGESSFRSWLLSIAHNRALNVLAGRRERPLGEVGHEGAGEEVAGAEASPAEALEEGERRARLGLKLRELRPAHRSVLVLRDLEGLSYEEIAEITDAPLGTVKGRLHRARSELIEVLRHNTYDWELPHES